MALLERLSELGMTVAGYGIAGGVVGVKLFEFAMRSLRGERADRRAEKTESDAVASLKSQVDLLSTQVIDLRQALRESDAAVREMTATFEAHTASLHDQIDRERELRRHIEDQLSAYLRLYGPLTAAPPQLEHKP